MVVKALVWILLLGGLGAGVLYTIKVMNEDPGYMVGYAFGGASDATIDMHIVVTLAAPMKDAPPLGADMEPDWPQWITDHYDVRDASGNAVSFRRNISSTAIRESDIKGGLPDSYLIGELQQGTTYTFKYTPIVGEPETYIYEFVAPSANEKFSRKTFTPNY